jgi:hypothetical protein
MNSCIVLLESKWWFSGKTCWLRYQGSSPTDDGCFLDKKSLCDFKVKYYFQSSTNLQLCDTVERSLSAWTLKSFLCITMLCECIVSNLQIQGLYMSIFFPSPILTSFYFYLGSTVEKRGQLWRESTLLLLIPLLLLSLYYSLSLAGSVSLPFSPKMTRMKRKGRKEPQSVPLLRSQSPLVLHILWNNFIGPVECNRDLSRIS